MQCVYASYFSRVLCVSVAQIFCTFPSLMFFYSAHIYNLFVELLSHHNLIDKCGASAIKTWKRSATLFSFYSFYVSLFSVGWYFFVGLIPNRRYMAPRCIVSNRSSPSFPLLASPAVYRAVTTTKTPKKTDRRENKYWNYIDFVLVYDRQKEFSIRFDSLRTSNREKSSTSSEGRVLTEGPQRDHTSFN